MTATRYLSKSLLLFLILMQGYGGGGGSSEVCDYMGDSLQSSRGMWGHAPTENCGILDSLIVLLRHSEGHLRANLVLLNIKTKQLDATCS